MITEKRREKGPILIVITVFFLILAVAIFAYLNAGNLDLKQELEMKAEFLLTEGATEYRVTMGDLLALKPVDFGAIMKTSTTNPTPVSLKGVELSQLFAKYNIQIKANSIIQISALDGYSSALTGTEVLTTDNVYLCIYMNGEVLKSKSEGGFGPYLLVIKNSQFSQRWCKFVEKISVR